MTLLALPADLGSTTKHIECSDDAWLMSMTLIFSFASAPKSRIDMPATPINPAPSSRIRHTSLMDEMPVIMCDGGTLFAGKTLADLERPFELLLISVPSN